MKMSEPRFEEISLFTLLSMWMSARLRHLRRAAGPQGNADQITAIMGRGGFPTGV
jgi:hypothetical protein